MAASLVVLLSGAAPLGADQLVLKVLQNLKATDTKTRAAFRRFIGRRALVGTVLSALAGLASSCAFDPGGSARQAIMFGLMGLPQPPA